jgi:hypothetical protein
MVFSTVTVARRLPDGVSIFTTELVAIYLVLEIANGSRQRSFLVCFGSVSSLQAVHNHKLEHSLVVDIFSKVKKLNKRKEV